jgi:uncharacterized membrane protein
MNLARWFRHLFATRRTLHKAFPPSTLDAIEAEIASSETRHDGEIRFAVESALEPGELRRDKSPRERAMEVFAGLGVWDTEENNGVLIYVLFVDHDVEIVADRAYNGRVTQAQWSAVCRCMERHFRDGNFEAGALAGVRAVDELIAPLYPPASAPRKRDELPNRPALL